MAVADPYGHIAQSIKEWKYNSDNYLIHSYRDSSPKERRMAVRSSENEFKNDLEEAYGVQYNPKAQKLFQIAWDYGHSAGYYEVLGYYDELIELIK